jgi:hypothetical protein
MLVRVTMNLGTNEFPDSPFLEGEEHEVTETLGNVLVQRNLAVDITPATIPVPKQEPAVETVLATAPKTKTSKEK